MTSDLFNYVSSKLNEDTRFHYVGKGGNLGVWRTFTKLMFENSDVPYEGWIDLHKNLARKGYGSFEIILYEETEQGLELKIRMYVPSYCEWETFFEGFVTEPSDWDRLMVMLGINEQNISNDSNR